MDPTVTIAPPASYPAPEVVVNLRNLTRSVCRDSFSRFVREFWSVVVPETMVWNWHIPYLCDTYQTAAERVFRGEPKEHDLIINVPPGTTKSVIFSVMAPAWTWTRMPTARHICGSYSFQPLALDLSRRCRDIVLSSLYRELFPDIELRGDQASKGYFVNTRGGSRLALGTGGVTGMHAHFIEIDDPVDPQKVGMETELRAAITAANMWVGSTLSTRKVDKEVTLTTLIMQRLHQNDPTGDWLERVAGGEAPVHHICLPAEASKLIRPESAKQYYVDGLLDSHRLPRHVLDAQFKPKGDYFYSSQFQQDPVPPGGGMFKIDHIDIATPPGSFANVVRYWDKAGTADAGSRTAGVKMGRERRSGAPDHFWILHVELGQWEAYRRECIIKQTAVVDTKRTRVVVEQEPGSSGKESAQGTIRNLIGFIASADRPTGDKIERADPFAAQVNAGNVSMVPGPWNRLFLDELRYFPFSTYKDQVDAASGAFNHLARKRAGTW